MPELSEKNKDKLLKAIEDGKIKDETSLAVFELVINLESEVEDLKGEVKQAVQDVKDSEVNLPKVLESVRGKDGKDSTVVGPKGPKGDKGDSIVGPQGKEGRPGKDSNIPGPKGDKGDPGKDGKDGVGTDGKDGSPDTAEEIATKLETLKEDKRLDVSAIKGIDKRDEKISGDILNRAIGILDQRSSFSIQKAEQMRKDIDSKVTGWGTHNLYVSATEPANPSLYDLWVDIS